MHAREKTELTTGKHSFLPLAAQPLNSASHVPQTPQLHSEGLPIAVRCKKRGFRPATIWRVNRDGTLDVNYEDEPKEREMDVAFQRVRIPGQSQPQPELPSQARDVDTSDLGPIAGQDQLDRLDHAQRPARGVESQSNKVQGEPKDNATEVMKAVSGVLAREGFGRTLRCQVRERSREIWLIGSLQRNKQQDSRCRCQ